MAMVGTKPDGTVERCRARPENRGKGRCPHGTHVEMDSRTVNEHNENHLKELFAQEIFKSHVKNELAYPRVTSTGLQSAHGEIARADFAAATGEISEAIGADSWELLTKFYDDFANMVGEERNVPGSRKAEQAKLHQAVHRVQSYLESDSATAQAVRAFLGPEIDLETFSKILVFEVNSMSRSARFSRGKGDSLRRVFLTKVHNDMTRRRYVASVLFFGGRCCYCRCVLTKGQGSTAASGEHIDSLSLNDDRMGTTRFGNMALACVQCNQSRGDKPLDQWTREENHIAPPQREMIESRIAAFRRFALYEPYSKEQAAQLNEAVKRVENEANRHHRKNGVYDEDAFHRIKTKLSEELMMTRELVGI